MVREIHSMSIQSIFTFLPITFLKSLFNSVPLFKIVSLFPTERMWNFFIWHSGSSPSKLTFPMVSLASVILFSIHILPAPHPSFYYSTIHLWLKYCPQIIVPVYITHLFTSGPFFMFIFLLRCLSLLPHWLKVCDFSKDPYQMPTYLRLQ